MAPRQTWSLRRTVDADVVRVHALLRIPAVYRYLTDGAVLSRASVAQWLTRTQAAVVVEGMGLWLLEDAEGHPAGCVSLERQCQPRAAELTYLLHPRWWGHGLATRMSWTVMHRAFEAGYVEDIVAGVDTQNTASVAVMRRLGMQVLRTVHYPLGPGVEYGYRRGDPAPKPLPTMLPVVA